MGLYQNEAILVTAVGSLPIRIGKQFGALPQAGQNPPNVLVFYNGQPKSIPDVLGECEFGEIEQEGDDTVT